MAIRMKDIARRLKLSQTTVSHVLTGKHEHYRISPATVERVRKTARDLGYRSSALARAFRDRRSYSVSLAVEAATPSARSASSRCCRNIASTASSSPPSPSRTRR
jgi:DNA-binding LacI/PurR family transcriptional regulator